MIIRTVVAAVASASVVVGTASAATLVVTTQPTLANIVVEIPPCGEESSDASISITWTPDRACTVPADGATTTTSTPAPTPESTQSDDVPAAGETDDSGPSQNDAEAPDVADTVVEPEVQLPPTPEALPLDEPAESSEEQGSLTERGPESRETPAEASVPADAASGE
jgi:hypothetical protein